MGGVHKPAANTARPWLNAGGEDGCDTRYWYASISSSGNYSSNCITENLLDLEKEETIESKRNCYRFYNYVKFALPNPDYTVMQAAADALGKIVQVGGTVFDEAFMEYEVPSAIELLQSDRQDPGRYAGVLILKALAEHNSSIFHPHIPLVFDKLLIPLRDPRAFVREAAADLLAACLDIVTQRERTNKTPFLNKILQDAQAGLKATAPDIIHGSLLTYRELLLHAGMFMKEVYTETVETILRLRLHKDPLVRKTIITLIPTLAMYDTQTFSESFMHKAMGHLLEQLSKPAERPVAFIAIGHVATSVGSEMKKFLEPIMDNIKQSLQMRGYVRNLCQTFASVLINLQEKECSPGRADFRVHWYVGKGCWAKFNQAVA